MIHSWQITEFILGRIGWDVAIRDSHKVTPVHTILPHIEENESTCWRINAGLFRENFVLGRKGPATSGPVRKRVTAVRRGNRSEAADVEIHRHCEDTLLRNAQTG